MPSTPDHLTIPDTKTADPSSFGGIEEKSRSVSTALILLLAMLFYQGYTSAIIGIGSPWIAKSFGLDQSGVAAVFAWLALSSLGALGLARMADKAGRRRVMMWCMTVMPLCALGAAVSTRLAPFVGFAILLNAFGVAAATSAIVLPVSITRWAASVLNSSVNLRLVIPIIEHPSSQPQGQPVRCPLNLGSLSQQEGTWDSRQGRAFARRSLPMPRRRRDSGRG